MNCHLFLLYFIVVQNLIGQTKTASHFAAWSSSLLSHEEYRKSQVVAGKSLGVELGIKGDSSQLRGSKGSDVSGINDWVDRTRRTISGVRKGACSGRDEVRRG